MRANKNTEKLAIQSLFDYIKNFNEMDKDIILNCLHFPHVAQSGENDPKVYKNKEEIWSYLGFLLEKLETEENWDHSTLDKVEVINSSEDVVHCNIEFNRRDKKNQSYAMAKGIFVATKKSGRWGLQMRIMMPASDGQKMLLAGDKILQ